MVDPVSIGRIVHYVLSGDDVAEINRRRTSKDSIRARMVGGSWPIGAQAHVGNRVSVGDELPMIIVAVDNFGSVNGQVFLDGNDVLWVTKRREDPVVSSGTWHWPERAKLPAAVD